MALTVKTFGSMNEAAAALASDRTARFISGGVLARFADKPRASSVTSATAWQFGS